jgi:hypothetical protein
MFYMDSLLDRVWKICIKKEDKVIEIRKLCVILSKNEYSPQITNKTIEVFVKNNYLQTFLMNFHLKNKKTVDLLLD